MLLKAAFVFVCMFLLDFAWARYTQKITEKAKVASGLWAMLIILVSGGATIGYVDDPWMLVPAALGAFVGTFVAVMLEERKDKNDPTREWPLGG